MPEKINVLLTFVGNTDPWFYKGSMEGRTMTCPDDLDVGPILGLCEGLEAEHRPHILYMFPSCKAKNPDSSRNTEWRAKWIEEILSKSASGIECHILPLDITDPTDFEQISREWARNVDSALDELKAGDNPGKYRFHVNCTSATQQMTAVAYVFASTGRIPGIIRWQCKEPRFVKDDPNGKRVVEVNATFLEENEYRKRMKAGAECLSFVSLQDSCKALSEKASSPRQRLIAEHLGKIFEAYVLMDALRYQDAYVKMRDEKDSSEFDEFLTPERRELLNDQVEMLNILQNGGAQENAENLTDLYFNMKRCLTRGAYADVLARFWRMGEGCVYHRLRTYHLVDIEARRIHFAEGREMLLSDNLRDPLRRELWNIFGKFGKDDFITLIDRRNKTIVAHGMRSVSKENAEACIPLAKKLLLALLPNVSDIMIGSARTQNRRNLSDKYPNTEALIATYPFREENIMTWVELF